MSASRRPLALPTALPLTPRPIVFGAQGSLRCPPDAARAVRGVRRPLQPCCITQPHHPPFCTTLSPHALFACPLFFFFFSGSRACKRRCAASTATASSAGANAHPNPPIDLLRHTRALTTRLVVAQWSGSDHRVGVRARHLNPEAHATAHSRHSPLTRCPCRVAASTPPTPVANISPIS